MRQSARALLASGRFRTVVAWAVAAPWLLWAAVRALGLDRGFPMVPLIAFTPYMAATAPFAILVALILRRFVPALLAGLATLALIAAVAPRAFSGGPEAPAGAPTLRVLSMNLHRSRVESERILELARETRADVLSVQELTAGEVARLDEVGLDRLFPHRVIALGGGVGGSAIYARRPLQPSGIVPGVFRMPRALMDQPGIGRVEIVAVHPHPPTSPERVDDWDDSLSALPPAGEGRPLRVLAGDFNATLDQSEFRDLIDSGYRDAADDRGEGLSPTWRDGSIWPPPLTIDHVLADERFAVASFSIHDLPGSDHEAVFAELAL